MKLNLEYWPLDRLIDYSRNPRKNDQVIQKMVASITEFGFTIPVLAKSDGLVIDGHLRIKAARQLKINEVPVVVADHLTDAQVKAFRLLANRSANWAEWDEELLRLELSDLRSLDVDLGLTGFDDAELSKFLDEPLIIEEDGKVDIDQSELLKEQYGVEYGQLWQLGKHRLLVGDATNTDDVARLLDGRVPLLMVTDPPYGVEYDANWRHEAGKTCSAMKTLPHHKHADGIVTNDDCADWSAAWQLFPGDIVYVWHAPSMTHIVAKSLVDCNLQIRSQIIWAKNHFAIGRGDYHLQHESCQPTGTLVSKVLKDGRWREHSVIETVPIETLQVGDKVVSFGGAKIYRRGRKITRIGHRQYNGNMHTLCAGGKMTRATAEHQFTIRFDPLSANKYIVYVMRCGNRWRVGISLLFNSRGFGLAVRLSQELGDEAWIVSTHNDILSARVAEQVVSCCYCIPTTHWETENKPSIGASVRTQEHIEQIYTQIGAERLSVGVGRLFADRGFSLDHPLIRHDDIGRFSRSQSRTVRACNLIPGIMQVPIPTMLDDFEWVAISEITFAHFVGEVWSMDVDQYQHYIADGIVTHNCWYCVRKSKPGRHIKDHKQTTLWQIDKPQKSETGHSTQKPIECMARPIRNHDSEYVYDPFCGSGTTIIACEQLKRSCLAMEINPNYGALIIDRFVKQTGIEPLCYE